MPPRPLVAVTDYLAESSVEGPILEPHSELRLLQANREEAVARDASNAVALLVFHDIKLGKHAFERLNDCKVVVRCGVGVDNIDLEAAGRRGIVVCNVPDYGSEEVADHALMLLLALARKLISVQQGVSAGGWDPTTIFGAPRLRGRTVGVIGCGRIGTAFALRAKALGMRVVIYDPYKPAGLDKALGVERVFRLDDLLRQAEFLSLHCPRTSETHHILNAATIAQLPKGAYIINTARGGCIDLDALVPALDSGHVACAALDVVEREPLDDERVRRHPKVLLTPHAAFYSVEGYRELRSKGAEEIRRVLVGEPVRNPVNRHVLQNPRCAMIAAEMPD